MARIARVVVPGLPHHITQRGCRRQQIFFSPGDYNYYLKLLSSTKTDAGVAVWAYCLMPNHVHLIVVPEHEKSLSDFLRLVHRKYAMTINKRMKWKGHLWQERFHSFVMDEPHLFAAARYVELNPVRARLCAEPLDWQWSSARAHLDGRDDKLVVVKPLLERIPDWYEYLSKSDQPVSTDMIRKHSRTGRPAGDEAFINRLEFLINRPLKKRKPGPKPTN
jgi:putative transposase